MKVLYFTGTGNSLHAAKMIGKGLKATTITRLDKSFMETNIKIESEKVVFVFPMYYSGPPKVVLDYFRKIDISEVKDIYAVVTRGSSASIIDKQLKVVFGDKLRSMHYVTMPGNYILMYAESNKSVKSKLSGSEETYKEIINDIKMNKTIIQIDKGISRSLGKPIYGYFKKKITKTDKNFKVKDSCDGCGVCNKVCPAENINMIHNKPEWQGGCQECMACIQTCPKHAIDYGKGIKQRARYKNPNIDLNELMR